MGIFFSDYSADVEKNSYFSLPEKNLEITSPIKNVKYHHIYIAKFYSLKIRFFPLFDTGKIVDKKKYFLRLKTHKIITKTALKKNPHFLQKSYICIKYYKFVLIFSD